MCPNEFRTGIQSNISKCYERRKIVKVCLDSGFFFQYRSDPPFQFDEFFFDNFNILISVKTLHLKLVCPPFMLTH